MGLALHHTYNSCLWKETTVVPVLGSSNGASLSYAQHGYVCRLAGESMCDNVWYAAALKRGAATSLLAGYVPIVWVDSNSKDIKH